MKPFLLILLSSFLVYAAQAQKIPQKVKKDFEKRYHAISKKERDKELKMTLTEYIKFNEQSYLKRQKYLRSLSKSRTSSRNGVGNLCTNGDFESGDINANDWIFYWEGKNRTNSGGACDNSYSTYDQISGSDRKKNGFFTGSYSRCPNDQVHHQVQSIGNDDKFNLLPKVPNYPLGNKKSLRLGNAHNNFGAEAISKKILITNSTLNLEFNYAVVMDNPASNHDALDLPFFEVNIIDAFNLSVNYNHLVNLGAGSNRVRSNNPLLTPNNTSAQRRWKNWTCINADLSSIIGKTVIIEFRTRDCWRGQHWCYAYLDNICIGCGEDDEGRVSINEIQTGSCGIPGKICVDYTLPNGNDPSLKLELELIQNSTVVSTLSSPTLNSGSSYCFNLNASNTNGLDTSLPGYDYKIIGKPKVENFYLSDKVIGNSREGKTSGKNNDCKFSSTGNSNTCCPGKNLIKNGDFERGNSNINSEFMFTSTVSEASVVPGKYTVVNGADAAEISPTWASIQDPSTCNFNAGKFLVTNGQNGAGPLERRATPVPEEKVIWQQTVKIDHWSAYMFCFEAKNLSQRGFDIKPKIHVKFSNPNIGDILNREINLGTGAGPCDWVDVQKRINLRGQGSTTVKIQIILNQIRHGDGNDIAIDNIGLMKLKKCPSRASDFNITTVTKTGYFSVNATGSSSSTCPYPVWTVCEIDPSNDMNCISSTRLYAPNAWAFQNNTNFPGYIGTTSIGSTSNVGKFEFGKLYKIIKGVYGDCRAWTQTSIIVYKLPGANNRVMKYTEKEFKAKKSQILRTFKSYKMKKKRGR